jgi:hypothetical protein
MARSGAVRTSVTVQEKYASGSSRLASNPGGGTWSGYSGSARCSGYWTEDVPDLMNLHTLFLSGVSQTALARSPALMLFTMVGRRLRSQVLCEFLGQGTWYV